jgi:cell division protein FtsB
MSILRKRNSLDWRGWLSRSATVHLDPNQDQGLRRFWIDRRRGIYSVLVIAGALWSGYNLVLSDHGLLRLWELRQKEADLTAQLVALSETSDAMDRDLQAPLNERTERGVREHLGQGHDNEIIYRFETVRPTGADSASEHTEGESAPTETSPNP